MGRSSNLKCSGCGYSASFTVGALMSDDGNVCRWPVSCADCNEISSANVLASPLQCSNCGSRNVVELQDVHAGDGGGTMLLRGEEGRVLKDGRYKCPRCGKFELRTERGLDPAWVD
jgi:DNA-directed RNA polymerase subunit RPC12/RpoP